MAITGTQLDALEDLTDAQMLKAIKQAIAQVLLAGQSYSSALQRNFTRADLATLNLMKRQYENAIAAASSPTGDMTALGDFG